MERLKYELENKETDTDDFKKGRILIQNKKRKKI